MNKTAVMQRIREIGLVPVLRASSAEEALAMGTAISEGGIPILEVTMTVPHALDVIRTLARDRPEILLGAGTVLDRETARICILEGAQFIVSPATDTASIEMCHRYSVAVLPGALTPTEVLAAWQAGADAVKIFPVSALGGARYVKSLKAPFPQIELIPTGGIFLANAPEFLEAGAFALGMGEALADAQALAKGGPSSISEKANAFRRLVTEFQAKADSPCSS